jgi:hypothetical protein
MRATALRMYRSEERDKDFLNVKVNLKTSYKFIKYCVICGCSPSEGNPHSVSPCQTCKKRKKHGVCQRNDATLKQKTNRLL